MMKELAEAAQEDGSLPDFSDVDVEVFAVLKAVLAVGQGFALSRAHVSHIETVGAIERLNDEPAGRGSVSSQTNRIHR